MGQKNVFEPVNTIPLTVSQEETKNVCESHDEAVEFFDAMIQSYEKPFDKDLVTFHDIADYFVLIGFTDMKLGRVMRDCGCVRLGQIRRNLGGRHNASREYPWSVRNHEAVAERVRQGWLKKSGLLKEASACAPTEEKIVVELLPVSKENGPFVASLNVINLASRMKRVLDKNEYGEIYETRDDFWKKIVTKRALDEDPTLKKAHTILVGGKEWMELLEAVEALGMKFEVLGSHWSLRTKSIHGT